MFITASDLSVSFGSTHILNEVSFCVRENEKIGVIGRNGVGKTTLFSILSKQLSPTSGTVTMPSQAKIGMLSQMPLLISDKNAYDNLLTVFEKLFDMESKLQAMQHQIALSLEVDLQSSPLSNNYALLMEQYEKDGGYSYHSRIRGILNGFGFSQEELARPVHTLSAGQQNKIAFAKLLLEEPDLLLLDEPTNFFDINSLAWLESYLKDYIGTVLIISHDRYFLDNVAEKIFEIEHHKLYSYNGNYTEYTKQKAKRLSVEQAHYAQQKKEIARQEEIIARFRQYNREKSIKQAESRQKALDKMQRLKAPLSELNPIQMAFPSPQRSGKTVVEIRNLSKSFQNKHIVRDFSHTIYRGQKIGIFGPNGIGKSTVLRMIAGRDVDYAGTISLGQHVQIAHYEQTFTLQNGSVLDEILLSNDYSLSLGEVRSYLANFLFTSEDVYKDLSVLSGGEKSRLNLLKILLKKANLLLLDEPTNHLDIAAIDVLEKALREYTGTIVLVSHDRYFLNAVCNCLLVFEGDMLKVYDGNYAYYLQRKGEQTIPSSSNAAPLHKKDEKKPPRDYSAKKMQRDIEKLETDMNVLENKIKEMEMQMCRPDFYGSNDYTQTVTEYDSLTKKLAKCEAKWLLLQEKIDSII